MLKGKVAIITGGSRGIGASIALKFASMGADIAIADYAGVEASQPIIDQLTELGVKAKAYKCDVSSFEDTKAVVAEIKKDFGAAHILVNNAGITRDGLIATMTEANWDAVLNTNLKGAFNMTRHCTGLFLRAKEGCIINISSVAGVIGNAGQANYSASKAGLIGLTKTTAKELGSKNIRCNAIAPGFIKTPMTESQTNNPLLSMIPLGRMGDAEDIAQAAAYLATANYVTGVVLKVDGGIAM